MRSPWATSPRRAIRTFDRFWFSARAVLNAAQNRTDEISRWATALAARRGYWRAIVAIAAKNVRMAWAVLSRGEQFAMPA
jgi:transposase